MRRIRKFSEYGRAHWVRMRDGVGTFRPIIVWDFECARYSKGTECILALRDCMRFARNSGFLNILYAANSRNDAMISEWADNAHFTKYLAEIVVRKKKHLKDVYAIVKKYDADLLASFVVSARLSPDIGFGNFLGFHTVWLKGDREPDQPFNVKTRPEVILQEAREFQDLLERFLPHAKSGSLVGLVQLEHLRDAVVKAKKPPLS